MFNIQTIKNHTTKEAYLWKALVTAAGGGFESNSFLIANNLILILQRKSYYSKIRYLLPMLGVGIAAARVPLVDVLNVGVATNTAFINSDFSQSTGLQGDGTTKYLDCLIKPSQLGTTNNGGLGFWENNISLAGNVCPMGTFNNANSNRYVIDLRTNVQTFRWGTVVNSAGDANTAINAHYYGQRSSATSRELFRNAASLGTNATNDVTSGASDHNMFTMGDFEGGAPAPWPGRCAITYFTNGTFSSNEISDFHNTLVTYLMIPTGKPQS